MTGNIKLVDIIVIAGITQGLFFTFLLFRNRRNRYANRFMAMVGIVVTLLIAMPLLNQNQLFNCIPIFLLFIICSPLLIGPLIFLYTKFLISPGLRYKVKDNSHFLLFLLWFLFLNIKYLVVSVDISQFLGTHHTVMNMIMWINIGQSFTYHIYILYLLRQYSKNIKESCSSIDKISLRWLKNMIILGVFFLIMMFTMMIMGSVLRLQKFDTGKWIVLAMALMLFVISYLAVRQPEIFQVVVEAKDFRKKYQTSGLSIEKGQELRKRLLDLMAQEKPYLNHLLSINDLAQKLSVPPWYVSQVINQKFSQNYFDFINKYRVEEAKKQLADSSKKHLSILRIAYDVGFNSKSTFNNAFKKYNKITPSHYRNNISTS